MRRHPVGDLHLHPRQTAGVLPRVHLRADGLRRGEGGLCCRPGLVSLARIFSRPLSFCSLDSLLTSIGASSHKSNYSLPQSIREQESPSALVLSPPVKAGSCTIFTEALTRKIPMLSRRLQTISLRKASLLQTVRSRGRARASGARCCTNTRRATCAASDSALCTFAR